MNHRFCRILALFLLSFTFIACATTQVSKGPAPEHLATAKRFLDSWDAADLAMGAFKRIMETESQGQPAGMVELHRRVFATIKAEEFEEIAAGIYARHLSPEHLSELTRFTESPTGNRFFRIAIARAIEGETDKLKQDVKSQFNADELTEIMKFAMSDEFAAMKKAIPEINREMSEAGREFGQRKMREYIDQQ